MSDKVIWYGFGVLWAAILIYGTYKFMRGRQ